MHLLQMKDLKQALAAQIIQKQIKTTKWKWILHRWSKLVTTTLAIIRLLRSQCSVVQFQIRILRRNRATWTACVAHIQWILPTNSSVIGLNDYSAALEWTNSEAFNGMTIYLRGRPFLLMDRAWGKGQRAIMQLASGLLLTTISWKTTMLELSLPLL